MLLRLEPLFSCTSMQFLASRCQRQELLPSVCAGVRLDKPIPDQGSQAAGQRGLVQGQVMLQFCIGRALQQVNSAENAELRAFDPAGTQLTIVNLADNPGRLTVTEINASVCLPGFGVHAEDYTCICMFVKLFYSATKMGRKYLNVVSPAQLFGRAISNCTYRRCFRGKFLCYIGSMETEPVLGGTHSDTNRYSQ